MPPMRSPRVFAVLCCTLPVAAFALAGCGEASDSTTGTSGAAAQSQPAPPRSDFPSAKGKTLGEVVESVGARPSELVVSPAAQVFDVGQNRYPFGVFERDGSQVTDAEVALYFAHVPAEKGGRSKAAATDPKAARRALDQPAAGPYPAAIESLVTEPQFRARTTLQDQDAALVVYTTQIRFPSKGEWRIVALIKDGDEFRSSLLASAEVGADDEVPRVGEKAPLIHTPTADDVGGDLSLVTTRIPPEKQSEVDYADVLGKEPIVLLFATPAFCESRVCGPVVDVAEQVRQDYGEKVNFIHMEIWEDNDPGTEKVRPQVRAFHLPTEPWLFAIDRDGRIKAELDGAFGAEALTRVVRELAAE
jgi:hypothetical protein